VKRTHFLVSGLVAVALVAIVASPVLLAQTPGGQPVISVTDAKGRTFSTNAVPGLYLIEVGSNGSITFHPGDVPPPTPNPPTPPPAPTPTPTPPPAPPQSDLEKAVAAFTKQQAAAASQAWKQASDMLAAGQTAAAALKAASQMQTQLRQQAFDSTVTPVLNTVLPVGQEPVDPNLRAKAAANWKALSDAFGRVSQ
jgi:type IV secretory pathway VirB10-like protein